MIIDSIRFSFIRDLPQGVRVLLYGAGGRGNELFQEMQDIRPDIDVRFFADTTKRGEIAGRKILSPEEISKYGKEIDLICICSHWWKNIAVDLFNRGHHNLCVLEAKRIAGSIKPCLVSHSKKFIYVYVYRAASSGIHEGLKISEAHDITFERINLKDPQYKDYFKFSFVRNPWDRVLSCYMGKFVNYQKKQGKADYYNTLISPIQNLMGVSQLSFDDYVEYVSKENDIGTDPHWRSLHAALCDENGEMLVDFVGRFENLEKDFATVCKKIGIEALAQKVSVSGKKGPFQNAYNARTKELIQTRFAKDIEMFNYSFDSPKSGATFLKRR